MPSAEISDQLNSRLQKIAIPLVDTHESVISRLVDHWEATQTALPKLVVAGEPVRVLDDGTMEFAPANPPALRFTTCLQVTVDGQPLPRSESHWNGLMTALIRKVHADTQSAEAVRASLMVNAELGRREDSGYKYLPDIGLSVQGQDSNAAYRQAYALAANYGYRFQIWFQWQANDKAAYPACRGLLEL